MHDSQVQIRVLRSTPCSDVKTVSRAGSLLTHNGTSAWALDPVIEAPWGRERDSAKSDASSLTFRTVGCGALQSCRRRAGGEGCAQASSQGKVEDIVKEDASQATAPG